MDCTFLPLAGAAIWFGILMLPWRPWATREFLEVRCLDRAGDLGDITALIPARNEAEFIRASLSGLAIQGSRIRVILVDDQSTDDTVRQALQAAMPDLRIIAGSPIPQGWTGKLWALEQGVGEIRTPLTLLMDADIELGPGILSAMRNKMMEDRLHFISLMAVLRMVSFWERLFMPAFVYFFKLLYPFHRSNSVFSRTAAAAGGCILMETRLFTAMGGFKNLRSELIDDCALANRVKSMGCKTWIGLTHSVRSHRRYDRLGEIWNMVARNAFAQLRTSSLLLLLCTLLMIAAFWFPVAGLFFPGTSAKVLSASALGAMMISYLPTLRFYGRSTLFALAMPLIGSFYLAMTWSSAVCFWRKKGAEWKGRFYR